MNAVMGTARKVCPDGTRRSVRASAVSEEMVGTFHGSRTMALLMPIILGLAALALAACATSTPSATPSLSSTQPSIDAVYSTIASLPFGNPLSPLFGGWPEDRAAIARLVSALEAAVPMTPTEHLTANNRGRYLKIHYRDGTRLKVRRVSWCDEWSGRDEFVGGVCRGEHKILNDIWWIEGTGMVKSSELGLWWEDMTTFMVSIGSISTPETIKAGESFPISGYGWADIVQAPTMNLSLESADGLNIELGEITVVTDSGYFEGQVMVPDDTPSGRYWLRVSSRSFSNLVDLVQLD